MVNKQRKELNITWKMSKEPMTNSDLQESESILAKLIARAFATDCPELFKPILERKIVDSED